MALLTQRAFSRLALVSEAAISQAIKRRRLEITSEGRIDTSSEPARDYLDRRHIHQRRDHLAKNRRAQLAQGSESGTLLPGVVCIALGEKDDKGFNRTLAFFPPGQDEPVPGELIALGWRLDMQAEPGIQAVDPQGARHAVRLFGDAPWLHELAEVPA